jgi:hypothetical protein
VTSVQDSQALKLRELPADIMDSMAQLNPTSNTEPVAAIQGSD